jgi:hypothetical protein
MSLFGRNLYFSLFSMLAVEDRERSGADAVFGNKRSGIAVGGRDAGGGDGEAGFFAAGDAEVEVEELGEEVGVGVEFVGGEDGGVEGGVGVFEGVLAGELEGSVEGTEVNC